MYSANAIYQNLQAGKGESGHVQVLLSLFSNANDIESWYSKPLIPINTVKQSLLHK